MQAVLVLSKPSSTNISISVMINDYNSATSELHAFLYVNVYISHNYSSGLPYIRMYTQSLRVAGTKTSTYVAGKPC